jgi:hypothetical protein
LEQIKKAIQLYFAGRQKIKPHASNVLSRPSEALRTVLFFCVRTSEEMDEIGKLLKEIKLPEKHLTALIFYPAYHTLDVVTDKAIFFFNLNDFTLFGKMKAPLSKKIRENSFNLFISFAQSPDPLSLLIASEINADFKVGRAQEDIPKLYDLTIEMDIQLHGYKAYYNQVISYLKVLNINKTLT